MAISVPITSTWEPKGLDKSISDIKRAEGGWAKAGVVAQKAFLPAVAALGAVGVAAGKAVSDASNLNETFNAVNKVFGKSAKTITDFGATAAQQTGLSQRAFQELATSTGSLLTNMGYSTDDAAEATIRLAERSADLASVFNTDVDTALAAVNAGLRGETEPLRALGVSLSAADIEAKAFALGLEDGAGKIDKHAKALATEALILEQSEKAAGDFKDTSEDMANAQRIMGAEVENLSASMGQALLPVMKAALSVGLRIVEWVKNNQTQFKIFIGVVTVLAAAIVTVNIAMKVWRTATLLYTAAQWALNAALTANPIGLVIAAIALLVAGLVLAYKKSETFRNIVDAVFGFIKRVVVGYINAWVSALTTVWGWLQKVIDVARNVKNAIKDAFSIKVPGFISGLFGGNSTVSVAALTPGARVLSEGSTRTTPRTININLNGGDPYATARVVKRALEGYDVTQGRGRGAPLALAW